ncbi:MAG TPA: asparaginase domain-containing protein, partial [Chloroflexota bacterium]|nr:asparaginase domain-containing protein [Chloroflexota bacterium]
IDRLGVGDDGLGDQLAAKADFDFYRAAPSGGYTKGLPERERTDTGSGDILPEVLGRDFFVYRPFNLSCSPTIVNLARLTNMVQRAMSSGKYAGAIWLEGSPSVEETVYWLSLLIDTDVPICGNASQRAHGSLSNDGDFNIVDSVDYIASRIWAGEDGRDTVGGVLIQDEQIFTSRDVQKADARPGGYVATGGHGGIVGSMGHPGPARLTFRPVTKHTFCSAVNMRQLPNKVFGSGLADGRVRQVEVQVKDPNGDLLADAIPAVNIVKTARFLNEEPGSDPSSEMDILARIEQNLREAPLAGFVAEGSAPYGSMTEPVAAALHRAALRGMPFVRVGRGNIAGFTSPPSGRDLAVAGSNLTATKARLLLMACLLRYGGLPPAADPDHPTREELQRMHAKLAEYQAVFDAH